MKFSQTQKDLLIGTLLGDGHLSTRTCGRTWRYCAEQKADHYDYVLLKYDLLKTLCGKEPKLNEKFDKRTNKTYFSYSFRTLNDNRLRFYGNLFYEQKEGRSVKFVPKNIHKFLTARALAFWYMDDGSLTWKGHSNGVRFCTDGFIKSDVERLQKALVRNFDLSVTITKNRDDFRLCVSESSYENLRSLILPHLIPCMYYKFPDGKRGIYKNESISNNPINKFDDHS